MFLLPNAQVEKHNDLWNLVQELEESSAKLTIKPNNTKSLKFLVPSMKSQDSE